VSIAPPARTFGQFLAEHEDGRFHASLTKQWEDFLAELHEAASLRGGEAKGKMTLAFEFSLDGGLVEVSADVATKTPKLKRGKSVFWLTPENHLSRQNPNQPELPLRDVTASAAAARNLA
jgi:hypothetical protein